MRNLFNNGDGDELLTVAETAEYLKLSEKSIRRYIDSGTLLAYLAGPGNIRIKQSDVENLLHKITN